MSHIFQEVKEVAHTIHILQGVKEAAQFLQDAQEARNSNKMRKKQRNSYMM